jgi:hypothetical protein
VLSCVCLVSSRFVLSCLALPCFLVLFLSNSCSCVLCRQRHRQSHRRDNDKSDRWLCLCFSFVLGILCWLFALILPCFTWSYLFSLSSLSLIVSSFPNLLLLPTLRFALCLSSFVFCLLSFVLCLFSFVFCLSSFVFCIWSSLFQGYLAYIVAFVERLS